MDYSTITELPRGFQLKEPIPVETGRDFFGGELFQARAMSIDPLLIGFGIDEEVAKKDLAAKLASFFNASNSYPECFPPEAVYKNNVAANVRQYIGYVR